MAKSNLSLELDDINGIISIIRECKSMDVSVLEATSAIRLIALPQSEFSEVAKLMRSQCQKIYEPQKLEEEINRYIFSESILVLGSYGNANDIPSILDYLKKDSDWWGEYSPVEKKGRMEKGYVIISKSQKINTNNRFLTPIAESLRRILVLNLEDSEQYSEDVINVCTILFEKISESRDLPYRERLFNSSMYLMPLVAKLNAKELNAGLKCLDYSNIRSLNYIMAKQIYDSIKCLMEIRKIEWLKNREQYALKLAKDLESKLA